MRLRFVNQGGSLEGIGEDGHALFTVHPSTDRRDALVIQTMLPLYPRHTRIEFEGRQQAWRQVKYSDAGRHAAAERCADLLRNWVREALGVELEVELDTPWSDHAL